MGDSFPAQGEAAGRPGGLQGRGLQLSTDVQEVVTEKDAPLQKQEEETDTVPDDTGLLHGQQAVPVPCHHLFGCDAEASMARGQHQKPCRALSLPLTHISCPLTIVVAFDCAHEAEELDDPAEVALHLFHEDTG